MSTTLETEVFVAGGGPAGLAAAIAARQRGFDVTVVDCATPPIDKACGEGIMPDGLAALKQLGISLSAAMAHPFEGIRFVHEDRAVNATFPDGQGYGIRRTRLHQVLIERAAELGVNMHWRTRVTGTSPGTICIDGREVSYRWLICADGQNSRLRAWSGLEQERLSLKRYGFRRHFLLEPWSDYVEIHWAECGQMYVTPVGPEEICIALITRNPQLRFCEALKCFPEMEARLRAAHPGTREQGAVSPSRKLKKVCREGIALVGEASGSVDAITGEGLSMSFRQATALADAMKAGDLAGYQRAHRRIARLPRAMSTLMLAMDQNHKFRKRVFHAFDSEPGLFSRLLAIHTGAISPVNFGAVRAISFGWHLLTA